MHRKSLQTSFIPYYTKLAYRSEEDSQLEAARAFGKYCDESMFPVYSNTQLTILIESKQKRVISEGGIEAILFLTSSDHTSVVQQASQVLTTLCSVSMCIHS
jgi:hypothetical protein